MVKEEAHYALWVLRNLTKIIYKNQDINDAYHPIILMMLPRNLYVRFVPINSSIIFLQYSNY